MLKLENIKKSFKLWNQDIEVLKWVNLEIGAWEFISIMWPSGSWKSTLLNILWMLDIPTSWKYEFEWKRVDGLWENALSKIRWSNIWFVFQSYNLISKMSVLHQVMLPLMYQWVPSNIRKEMALKAIEQVWLSERINNKPTELSWWQQQRVSIARALVINPKIMLADEPTWALDSVTWTEIMELLTMLNKWWKTIILITHEDMIANYAKRHIRIMDWLIQKWTN